MNSALPTNKCFLRINIPPLTTAAMIAEASPSAAAIDGAEQQRACGAMILV
jgi:hypothetical protein